MVGCGTKRITRLALATFVLAGCVPTAERVDPEVEALVRSLQSDQSVGTNDSTHDLGTVLARGQAIRHEFTLRNPSDIPIRILGAQALTPCCSSVDKLPEIVEPKHQISVPVTFNPGPRIGQQRLEFLIKTDHEANAINTYHLTANLIPEIEIRTLRNSEVSVSVGRGATQRFEIITRRNGEQRKSAPVTATASSPLVATLEAERSDIVRPDGPFESRRELLVEIPPSGKQGLYRGAIALRWNDGSSLEHVAEWRVTPVVKAFPPAILLSKNRAGDSTEHKIGLAAEDRPFRVVAVKGSAAANCTTPLPTSASLCHDISVVFDDATLKSEKPLELVIETDHPGQSSIIVSVVALASKEGTTQ